MGKQKRKSWKLPLKTVTCRECGKEIQRKKDQNCICRSCQKPIQLEKARAAYHRDYEKTRNRHLKRNYGITLEEYEILFQEQEGCCKICQRPPDESNSAYGRLYVDHHHGSRRIRGLLCTKCNSAIGFFDDDLRILESAIDYLRS